MDEIGLWLRQLDSGWLQETYEVLSYGSINTNYKHRTVRVCLLWQRRARGTVGQRAREGHSTCSI
eukprot:10339813-Prorocentrum_lima.AAC.1